MQKIPGWSDTVKRLFDAVSSNRKLKVVLLGSASLPLQQGLADSLAGRYELIRVDHWNLDECERAFGWDLDTFLRNGGRAQPRVRPERLLLARPTSRSGLRGGCG